MVLYHKHLELLLLLLLYAAAAEFVQLTEALEVLLDTAARVCITYRTLIHCIKQIQSTLFVFTIHTGSILLKHVVAVCML